MSNHPSAALLSRRLRLGWRVAAVLAASIALHAWVLNRARGELDFELPPPAPTLQVELFRMPAQVAVTQRAAPTRRATRAITPPAPKPAPPATIATPPPVVEPPPPEPAPSEVPAQATPPGEELLPSTTANALPQPTAEPSPLDAVMVSFPRVGRFISNTTYTKGILQVVGSTMIEWRIGADAYEATSVTTDINGKTLLTLSSRGDVRPSVGVAPVRYTEQRLSRAPVAVNFQWDTRKVTFSAASAEFPLNEGVQDQLSFMAQLALLAQAFPDRFLPGAPVALEVAGTRNVRVYDLRVIDWETVSTPTGPVNALKLDRVIAPGTRDARIELWLAPSLRWLPVRTRTTLTNEDVIETVLKEVWFVE